MRVYRITLEKYSRSLHASGRVARWNSSGTFVIYTAGSRSLACLENLVHRSGEGLDGGFRVMTIEIPDEVRVDEIGPDDLPENWREFGQQLVTRALGDEWVGQAKAAVLKVPSAIIPDEFNYIINPAHGDFAKVSLVSALPFSFDRRL